MGSVFFQGLRRMRTPLIVLVLIYAISLLGLVLIPGVDAQGKPAPPMSFFHAFYFITYTASTIGFGELPTTFSDGQRLWVTACIFLVVIGWTYSIFGLLALVQDQGFLGALAAARLRRQVRRLGEPFYLVCGYGESGSLLCRSLDRLSVRFVVLDIEPSRLDELELADYRCDTPALAADARAPETLIDAGLCHRQCRGVIALTNDDAANLAIAIAVRLLNSKIAVLARAESTATAASMAAFGADHIINPFEKFGEYLALAVNAPGCYRLLDWLTGTPGTTLGAETEPPRGHWVVCGYGRFGQAVTRNLERQGLPTAVIHPNSVGITDKPLVQGIGTEAQVLRQAGIEQAVGLVAGTDDDVDNLSIAMAAKALNPDLFVVMRQNLVANSVLFDAFDADVTMVASEIIAHECLAIVTTPLLSTFLDIVKRQGDACADEVIERLQAHVGSEVPITWSIRLDTAEAPAVGRALQADRLAVPLECLCCDLRERTASLDCLPLLLMRNGQEWLLPDADLALAADDQLLFAGTAEARSLQSLTLQNANVFHYIRTGREISGGWLWRKLAGAAP